MLTIILAALSYAAFGVLAHNGLRVVHQVVVLRTMEVRAHFLAAL